MRPIQHGTVGGYTNRRCRCDECRRALREDRRRYYQRLRKAHKCIVCLRYTEQHWRCDDCRGRVNHQQNARLRAARLPKAS